LPEKLIGKMRWGTFLGPLLRSSPVQRFLKWRIGATVRGPEPERRERARTQVWGEVEADDGSRLSMTMTCPDGYTLTASAAVDLAQRVRAGDLAPGAWTPAAAFGPDLVLGYPGVRRSDPFSDSAT
jgi:short subunit dehydrogenase-like uncharacterized protein